MAKRSPRRWSPTKIAPAFVITFFSSLFLTVLSLGVSVYLVGVQPATEETKSLLATCSTTWKMGFGVIVGLIGGKTLP